MKAPRRALAMWRLASVLCLLSVATVSPLPSVAGGHTAWQEMVLLTVAKVRHAASHCGFRADESQLDALLASAALNRADLDQPQAASSLSRQVTADDDAYGGDPNAACAQAWDRFGSDGAPGLRDLLRR